MLCFSGKKGSFFFLNHIILRRNCGLTYDIAAKRLPNTRERLLFSDPYQLDSRVLDFGQPLHFQTARRGVSSRVAVCYLDL